MKKEEDKYGTRKWHRWHGYRRDQHLPSSRDRLHNGTETNSALLCVSTDSLLKDPTIERIVPLTGVRCLAKNIIFLTFILLPSVVIQGPFEKFVDSPYYSESELCGGAVTVSFSKYLPW
jgi:hypothetical protein